MSRGLRRYSQNIYIFLFDRHGPRGCGGEWPGLESA
nr:MAG TPA: hypothetical protein [Caudoviricetes sp.]